MNEELVRIEREFDDGLSLSTMHLTPYTHVNPNDKGHIFQNGVSLCQFFVI